VDRCGTPESLEDRGEAKGYQIFLDLRETVLPEDGDDNNNELAELTSFEDDGL